ncbi:ABC transporter permease [Streptomyces morookaense]|uniref:Transport permease protein n=1 Tax=Streptomyces morookaense TaxID=1970 RepID=A0A7Y7B533_STRMO|nr:ABC transporter permease [Streptomyces morookaense]NVK79132.1 ABC transporter permease [Streptomyces morookaense]GHF28308.1 transport permease protein [Streptomyces morookaense]
MSASATKESITAPRLALPLWKVAVARSTLEIKQFFREKGQVVFTFGMPLLMLVLLASIFKQHIADTGVDAQQIYVTGMLGVGIMATSFQSMVLQVVGERANGTLKRLRSTPMPKSAYFAGKVAVVLVSSLGQAVILLGLGTAFFGLKLPTDPARWLTFAWVFVLGIVSCTLLGLAYSSYVRPQSAGAMVFLPVIVLQFISGVFIPFNQLPHVLRIIASFFPMKWICQGMRSVFLPDTFRPYEPGHSWGHGQIALALGAYAVVGLLVCLKTFRWKSRNDG